MPTPGPSELLERFWKELREVRTGMLGLAGDRDARAQPMTAHFESQRGPIYFYARKDSPLAEDAAQAQAAVFHYAAGGHDLFACVHGELSVSDDPQMIDRFWSEEVARWYPAGRGDGNLTLLRFEPDEARIWLPSNGANASRFGFRKGAPEDVRGEVRM